ncbi:MAG: rhodanese-like domain-containing protein, partial [Pseudomonadota bacterium]
HVSHCTNVAEGFEGDLDADGHRGTINGWKAHGLPWRQS